MQIETINHAELCEILAAAIITNTANHAGMLTHSIEHPTIGTATTIQGNEGGALLIKAL